MSELPQAANRVNTIFMTTYFVFGALGTMLSSTGWKVLGWNGVGLCGLVFALLSLVITLCTKNK